MKPITLALVAVLYLCVAATSGADTSIEDLAKVVCKTSRGSKTQISNVSQLKELVEFLRGASDDHKLHQCRSKYLDSLEELVHVLDRASDNVCGDEKLRLIEDYHRKYVSKVSRHQKEREAAKRKAPTMAKLLFMQYAVEVSSRCELAALDAVNESQLGAKGREDELASLEKLRKFTDSLGMTDLAKGYKGIYLFWNMVDSLGLADNEKFAAYLRQPTTSQDSGVTRISVQMRDARGFNALQALCRYQLRPVYAASLLPVLRLIDLGYYPRGTKLMELMAREESTARSHLFAAQICETLLPVAAFADQQLGEHQFVAITLEEGAKLAARELEGLGEEVPVKEPQDELKANVASRGRIINRMLKQVWAQMREKLRSVFAGGFKLFRKLGGEKLEPLDEVDVTTQPNPMQIVEDEVAEVGARRKRGWMTLAVAASLFLYAFYCIILIAVKIALFLAPTIILGFVALFGLREWPLDAIAWMWFSGWDPISTMEDWHRRLTKPVYVVGDEFKPPVPPVWMSNTDQSHQIQMDPRYTFQGNRITSNPVNFNPMAGANFQFAGGRMYRNF